MTQGFATADWIAIAAILVSASVAAALAKGGNTASVVAGIIAACFAIAILLITDWLYWSLLNAHHLFAAEAAVFFGSLCAASPASILLRREVGTVNGLDVHLLNPEILAPADGTEVAWETELTGKRVSLNQRIQVLLLSGDGKWWVQEQPRYDGLAWRARCWFGTQEGRAGERFPVVAIATDRALGLHVDAVPTDCPRSSEAVFYRKRNS